MTVQDQIQQLVVRLTDAIQESALLVCATKEALLFDDVKERPKQVQKAEFEAARTAHGHLLDTKERIERAQVELRRALDRIRS